MNSPLVIEQVRRVVNRDEFQKQKSTEDRVRFLYDLFFQRPPTEEEIRFGVEFVSAPKTEEKSDLKSPELQPISNDVTPPNQRKRKASQITPSAARQPPKTLNRWQEYAHALLLSNEASFLN